MYYVYILRSIKDKGLYIGYTQDLKKRFSSHNNRENLSTKHRAPFELVFYETFVNRIDAKHRETYLKSGWGTRSLKKILKKTLDGVI